MKRTFFPLTAATLIVAASSVSADEAQIADSWPRAELNHLPMVYFHANERKEAAVYWLDPELQTVTIDGATADDTQARNSSADSHCEGAVWQGQADDAPSR